MDRNAEARRQTGGEEIKYFVNGEEVVHAYEKPPDREVFKLTVREILTSAGFAPPEEYELTSDADNHLYTSLDEEVPVDFGERFTATHTGVTPVSRSMTIGDFEAYVRGLGYAVETVQGADEASYVVVRDVELSRGCAARPAMRHRHRTESDGALCAAGGDTHSTAPRSDGWKRATEDDGERNRPRLAVLESSL